MNEIAFVFLYVFASSSPAPLEGSNSDASSRAEVSEWSDHAEADAFWCFSALIGEARDLFDFDGIDHASAGLKVSNVRGGRKASLEQGNVGETGMAGALKRFSLRLKWVDEEIWYTLVRSVSRLDLSLDKADLCALASIAGDLAGPAITLLLFSLARVPAQHGAQPSFHSPSLGHAICRAKQRRDHRRISN